MKPKQNFHKTLQDIFLTGTNTKLINCETDYTLKGFKTIFYEKYNLNEALRAFVVTSTQNHQINILFNIIEIFK